MSKVRQRSVSGASLDWRIRKTFFSLKGCVNVVYNKVLIQPAEQAACSPLWLSLFGAKSAVFTYIPKWVGLFDSFETPPLPLVESTFQVILDSCRHFYDASAFRHRLYSFKVMLSYLREKRPAALARGAKKNVSPKLYLFGSEWGSPPYNSEKKYAAIWALELKASVSNKALTSARL